MLNRRAFLGSSAGLLSGALRLFARQSPQSPAALKPIDPDPPGDWTCPMDPEVRMKQPGKCPRCGMTLRLHVPERREFDLVVTHAPPLLRPNAPFTLTFRVVDPDTGALVTEFEIVHERLMHLFLVSSDLEYFAHVHPVAKQNGLFELELQLPESGMYRLLADFYPKGSVPQLAVDTLYLTGPQPAPHLKPSLGEAKGENLSARLTLDPERPLAGLETKLFFELTPSEGLEPYIGAWGHMLAASEDLIDLIHIHPFLADGGPNMQFNAIFPRPGLYRIWTQFQRKGVVNTVVFTVPVVAL